MKTAFYHQHGKAPLELEVLAEGKGTVDLGREGEIVIKGCKVSEEATPGFATLKGKTSKNKSKESKPVIKDDESEDEDEDDKSDLDKDKDPAANTIAPPPAGMGAPK